MAAPRSRPTASRIARPLTDVEQQKLDEAIGRVENFKVSQKTHDRVVAAVMKSIARQTNLPSGPVGGSSTLTVSRVGNLLSISLHGVAILNDEAPVSRPQPRAARAEGKVAHKPRRVRK